MVSERIEVPFSGASEATEILGKGDQNLRLIQKAFRCKVWVRGQVLFAEGDPREVRLVRHLVQELRRIPREGYLGAVEARSALSMALDGKCGEVSECLKEGISVSSSGKEVRPKTPGQRAYIDAIQAYDIVFCVGPAGTGKTYLAVAAAAHSLSVQGVGRVILVRPAVEAGESLGFLPGALEDKVAPYLRPLYDALHDVLGGRKLRELTETGVIEIAPLAYMRGRSLNDAFVILDEGQNATIEQMKMFLTRLGFGSKAVVTGDVTQVDLPKNVTSGLVHAFQVLQGVEDIGFVELTGRDVVRHRLVHKIIEAYAREEALGEEIP